MTTPTGESTHDDAACLELFTDTLARLNQINEAQMQSILDLAIAAADAANSISPSNTSGDFVERVTTLVDQLKSEAAARDGEMGPGGRPALEHSDENGKTFCESVQREIGIAINNGLASQQQLYVIGASVLTEGANLLMTRGGEPQE